MSFLTSLDRYWHEITAWGAMLDLVLAVVTIGWVLTIKKDTTSALAWCLLIIFLPVLGMALFVLLGYNHVHRPVTRKKRHKTLFRRADPDRPQAAVPGPEEESAEPGWEGMARLAQRFDAFPLTRGNQVRFFYEGLPAYLEMKEALQAAKQHIHLEYFIIQPDDSGQKLVDLLVKKAQSGVEVRVLYDAMGSHRLHRRFLKPLFQAGGRACAFLPLDPLRRRIQVNMRNHRKIAVVDGRVAFTGGLNIGNEYLGEVPRFGFWRDTHVRLEGPAVASLQRVFAEDWDFAAGEHLKGPNYFPSPAEVKTDGDTDVQVIHSGPDQTRNGIREVYFAAILRARERLWIASPYFVPDAGLYDALCLAGYLGVDVRLLCQFHPDKWIPFFAGRYYFGEVLRAGVKVYQYTKGMMHSKVVLVDGQWASVGTANLDNRSLHLNFEVNCLIHTPERIAELEGAFLRDLTTSIRLDRAVFAQRPFAGRLVENACRLMSPIL